METAENQILMPKILTMGNSFLLLILH